MYTLVLLSGGTGSRMNKSMPKQYLLLAGKPVIMHTIERVAKIKEIKEIIIVCTQEYRELIATMLKQYNIHMNVKFAPAGETRQASVYSGISLAMTPNVVIHEAARPFVPEEDFRNLILEPDKNAMYGISIPFTVIRGHGCVEGILERSELVNVQLPQKFDVNLLKEAHQKAKEENRIFTEDASLVYNYFPDANIAIVQGKDYNIKLTTEVDLVSGEQIYREYFARRK